MKGYIQVLQPKYNNISLLTLDNNEIKVDHTKLSNIKFFHNDLVTLYENTIKVDSSNIINKKKKIAGVLILKTTVKYGSNKRGVPYYMFQPLDWRYPNFLVASKYRKRENIYVEIYFHKWERKIPNGTIDKIIGPVGDIKSDNEAILSKYFLNHKNINNKFKSQLYDFKDDLKDIRKDFRNLNIFAIDPLNCTDIDDALHFRIVGDNIYEIGIHIADVTHFVRYNNDIDIEAKKRLTSIYSPDKIINMLPTKLSHDLCSLKENEDRLTISLILRMDSNANIISYEIIPGIIKCRRNYSYSQVDEIISSNSKLNELDRNVKELFDFSKKITEFGKDDSHGMIEKYMIIANKIICEDIIKNNPKKQIIIRKHEKPNELEDIPDELYNDLFYRYFSAAKYDLYNSNETSHFGLNLEFYTHFTSPIRRYADIIVHRIIRNRWLSIDEEDICKVIENINETNSKIRKAERNFHFLNILRVVSETGILDNIDAYVLDWTDNFSVRLYIPQFKIEINSLLYHRKIQHLFDLTNVMNKLTITKDGNQIEFTKYQKVKVSLISREKEGFLNKKILVDITSPNLMI
jgi:exoribonuclease R